MKKVLIVFLLLLLASPALPQSAVPFATYMTGRPSGSLPLAGTEPTLIFQGGLVKQVSTQAYVLQGGNNPPGINSIGSGGPTPYALFNLNAPSAAPSLAFAGSVPFAINSSSNASAFVCAQDVTNAGESWCQARNWIGNGALTLLLQPMGGGVAFDTVASGLELGLIRGIQQGPSWMSSTYEPEAPTAFADGGIDVWQDASGVTANPGGINVHGRTDKDLNGFNTQNYSSFCYANNSSGSRGCWPWYSEGHRMQVSDYSFGLGEIAAVNRFNGPIPDLNPLNVNPNPGINGIQIDCGNSQPSSAYTEYSCSSGIFFTNNLGSGQTSTVGFKRGIVFRSTALDPTLTVHPEALSMPSTPNPYSIAWYDGGNQKAWDIYSNAGTASGQTLVLADTAIVNSAHTDNGGGTPTAGSCSGFATAPGSTDSNGAVTFSSAATCSIKFNVAFVSPPFCVITPASTPSALVVATANTTTLTATFSGNLTGMIWHCAGL